ncbi:small acid-soluble spore protein Tlp [Niallia sp. 01092]|uniref:small acid-soluble spore protein Tlp n=1 Tax=unclassified Niallia TaxID=2837522 RepID=UPI003FD2A580
MLNKPNQDNRLDNVEKLQDMAENTVENIEKSEQTLSFAGEEEKAQIEQKNKRREQSLQAFKEEIKDEASDRENGYQ